MTALSTKPRILIILMGALGDVARGLCVGAEIKRHWPAAYITWLVEPKCLEFVKLAPFIDSIIVFDRPRGFNAFKETVSKLRRERIDLTIDLQRHLKSGLFSFLSGAKTRIGFNRRNCKEFNWLFNNRYIDPVSDKESKTLHYLKFVEKLGIQITKPVQPDFGLSSFLADINFLNQSGITETDRLDGYLVFVLGSTWQTKDWFEDGYMSLAQRILAETGKKIVLVGDKSKIAMAASLSRSISSKERVINLAGRTTIIELLSVLSHSLVTIGPDSGPGHLCAALNRRYITLFGPTTPQRVAAWGQADLIVSSAIGCSPCNRKKCPGLNNLCMRLISPETVWDKIEDFLCIRN